MKTSTFISTSWVPSTICGPLAPSLASAFILALGLLTSVACDHKSPPPLASAEVEAAPGLSAGASASAAAPASASADTIALATGLDALTGRLAHEARDRPKVHPTADDVLATLEGLGEVIGAKQQSLGDTYKANYCIGGYTIDGLFALSACEYADAAAAAAGRELSKKILSQVTARDVWNHKATTLAIVQLKPDDATTAKKKKLVAAFVAM